MAHKMIKMTRNLINKLNLQRVRLHPDTIIGNWNITDMVEYNTRGDKPTADVQLTNTENGMVGWITIYELMQATVRIKGGSIGSGIEMHYMLGTNNDDNIVLPSSIDIVGCTAVNDFLKLYILDK